MERREDGREGRRRTGDAARRSRAVDHRRLLGSRRLRIRHGRGIDPSVVWTSEGGTPHRSSCGPHSERTHDTASDHGTRGASPACESPGRSGDPRAGTIRYPGASSSPTREGTDDPGSGTAEDASLRAWSPHGRISPWLGATWVRTRTGRRRGRGTGPPDRSPLPRHPSGDTPADDGFGRRTNSLSHTYVSRRANASRTAPPRSPAVTSGRPPTFEKRQRRVNSVVAMVYHRRRGARSSDGR